MRNSNANSAWITTKLESILMVYPNLSNSSMKQILVEKYGVVPTNGNRGMFLVAITVVEIENRDSRTWFLRLVRETLQSVPEWKDDFLCVMFDQQKHQPSDNGCAEFTMIVVHTISVVVIPQCPKASTSQFLTMAMVDFHIAEDFMEFKRHDLNYLEDFKHLTD
ncbi:hypothetical protein JHK85_043837 [Glycine max]|nr:hypothetical protein JHK85_043837 [Glycine max]